MKYFLSLIFVFQCSTCISSEVDITKLLIPDFAQAQIVSDNMNVNGVNMGVIQFATDKSVEDVEEFYRNEIGEIKASEFEQWKIISWIKRKYLYTVQMTKDDNLDKVHGYISVSPLPYLVKKNKLKNIELGRGFPKIAGSSVVNDIKAVDLNKHSRTLWITNKSSVESNLKFYKTHYLKKGWLLEHKTYDATRKVGALLMRKGSDEANLVFSNDSLLKVTNVNAVIVEK